MTRYSGFISLLLALAFAAAAAGQTPTDLRSRLSAGQACRFRSEITFRGNELTGLCVLRETETACTGALVNEFGVKALDFVFDKRSEKVKLHNVIFFLDKWYIRRVVRADLAVMLRALSADDAAGKPAGKRELLLTPQGEVRLTNLKYHISYHLTPLETDAVTE